MFSKAFLPPFTSGDSEQRDSPAARQRGQAGPGQGRPFAAGRGGSGSPCPLPAFTPGPGKAGRGAPAPLPAGCPGPALTGRRPLTAAVARATTPPPPAPPQPPPARRRRCRRSQPQRALTPLCPGAARRRREERGGKGRRSRRYRRPCPHPARRQWCGTEGCALTWSLPPRPAGREEEEEEAMLQRSQAPLLTQRGGRAVPGSPPPAGGPAPYRRPLRWSRAPPVPLLPRQAGEGRARSAPGARPPAPGGRSVGRVGRSAALPVPSRPVAGQRGAAWRLQPPTAGSGAPATGWLEGRRRPEVSPAGGRLLPRGSEGPEPGRAAPAPRLTWKRRPADAPLCLRIVLEDGARGAQLKFLEENVKANQIL